MLICFWIGMQYVLPHRLQHFSSSAAPGAALLSSSSDLQYIIIHYNIWTLFKKNQYITLFKKNQFEFYCFIIWLIKIPCSVVGRRYWLLRQIPWALSLQISMIPSVPDPTQRALRYLLKRNGQPYVVNFNLSCYCCCYVYIIYFSFKLLCAKWKRCTIICHLKTFWNKFSIFIITIINI